MLDPTGVYRTSQVVSASPVGRIVLLYQGAIRFGTQHLAFLERGETEQAHRSSMRCQEIVAALRGCLDLSAGPIAIQLDQLYDFVQRRLMDGNLAKQPKPTQEALQVLRGLLEAWQQIAATPQNELAATTPALTAVGPGTISSPAMAGAGRYTLGARR